MQDKKWQYYLAYTQYVYEHKIMYLMYFWLSFNYFRVLLRNARKLAQSYYLQYQENIPTAQIVHKIANVMQEYTQSG